MVRFSYICLLIVFYEANGFAQNIRSVKVTSLDRAPTPLLVNDDGDLYSLRLTEKTFQFTSLSARSELKSYEIPFETLPDMTGFRFISANLDVFFTANGDLALMGDGVASVPGRGKNAIEKTATSIGMVVSAGLKSYFPLEHNFVVAAQRRVINGRYMPERDIYIRYIYLETSGNLEIHTWHLNEGSHKLNPPFLSARMVPLSVKSSRIVLALERQESERSALTIYSLSKFKESGIFQWHSKAVATVTGPSGSGENLLSELKIRADETAEMKSSNVYFGERFWFGIEKGRVKIPSGCALPFGS